MYALLFTVVQQQRDLLFSSGNLLSLAIALSIIVSLWWSLAGDLAALDEVSTRKDI
jgi:hypothetical protein